MTVLVLKSRVYPADLWLTYRGIRYRPAALQLFVARGGWGKEFAPKAQISQTGVGQADPPIKAASALR